jgi:hypothetical protein
MKKTKGVHKALGRPRAKVTEITIKSRPVRLPAMPKLRRSGGK